MHLYTKCRFCKSELPKPDDCRQAFCNPECKRLYRDYGSIPNWNNGVQPIKRGSRKTNRKNKPSHTPEGGKLQQPPLKRATDDSVYVAPVSIQNTDGTWVQTALFTEYPDLSPPLSNRGGNPRRKRL